MSIKSDRDLAHLQTIGRVVRKALESMAAAVRPGIATAELNSIGSRLLASEGARSAPPLVYGYPADVCISVNEEAIHGIPGSRLLAAGDLVKLDLVAEKNRYFATALIRAAESAFRAGAKAARVGARVYDIGRDVKSRGFSALRELCGHGVGRTIHEEPSVPNYRDPRSRSRLTGALAAHYEHTIVITRGAPILLTAAA